MMQTTSKVVRYEFLGLEAEVVKSSNPDVIGIKGKVIDETRNTFTILCNGKQKIVIKETAVFEFVMSDAIVLEIEGKLLMGRPEDRIKKRPRRLW